MDLLSAFKRNKPAAQEAPDGVQLARTRARQRLIGAAVLVVVGIVGFPLLFETEPRPIPVDLPIEIPTKDAVAPLKPPPPPLPAVAEPVAKQASVPAAPGERVIEETAADEGREVKAAPAAAAASTPAARTAAVAEGTTKPRAEAPAQGGAGKRDDAAAADAARAKALLEGKSVAAADTPPSVPGTQRFVVQVGAFADPESVKATRAKVERLGLVTYTQVAETSAGARTRVRVGPFATRAEAERAAARIKAANLPGVILVL